MSFLIFKKIHDRLKPIVPNILYLVCIERSKGPINDRILLRIIHYGEKQRLKLEPEWIFTT